MRIDPPRDELLIAQALLSAPGWARVGITSPKAYQREDAARELARVILANSASEAEASGELRLSL
jgi:predicted TPR repeat methyltransferase